MIISFYALHKAFSFYSDREFSIVSIIYSAMTELSIIATHIRNHIVCGALGLAGPSSSTGSRFLHSRAASAPAPAPALPLMLSDSDSEFVSCQKRTASESDLPQAGERPQSRDDAACACTVFQKAVVAKQRDRSELQNPLLGKNDSSELQNRIDRLSTIFDWSLPSSSKSWPPKKIRRVRVPTTPRFFFPQDFPLACEQIGYPAAVAAWNKWKELCGEDQWQSHDHERGEAQLCRDNQWNGNGWWCESDSRVSGDARDA